MKFIGGPQVDRACLAVLGRVRDLDGGRHIDPRRLARALREASRDLPSDHLRAVVFVQAASTGGGHELADRVVSVDVATGHEPPDRAGRTIERVLAIALPRLRHRPHLVRHRCVRVVTPARDLVRRGGVELHSRHVRLLARREGVEYPLRSLRGGSLIGPDLPAVSPGHVRLRRAAGPLKQPPLTRDLGIHTVRDRALHELARVIGDGQPNVIATARRAGSRRVMRQGRAHGVHVGGGVDVHDKPPVRHHDRYVCIRVPRLPPGQRVEIVRCHRLPRGSRTPRPRSHEKAGPLKPRVKFCPRSCSHVSPL